MVGLSEEFSLADGTKQQLMKNILSKESVQERSSQIENAYNFEMANKNIKDFKGRSRTNVVSRVAKRISV